MVVGKPFLTVEQIQRKVREIGGRISDDYAGKDLLAVGILKGAFMFFSDLVKSISVPLNVDFLVASSYCKSESTGKLQVRCDIAERVEGRDVLLVEDIVDTGITLNCLREGVLARDPRSLKICTFLDKKARREVHVPLDYVGFEIQNEFVVGYGLDYDNQFRNLPYISVFKKKS